MSLRRKCPKQAITVKQNPQNNSIDFANLILIGFPSFVSIHQLPKIKYIARTSVSFDWFYVYEGRPRKTRTF